MISSDEERSLVARRPSSTNGPSSLMLKQMNKFQLKHEVRKRRAE